MDSSSIPLGDVSVNSSDAEAGLKQQNCRQTGPDGLGKNQIEPEMIIFFLISILIFHFVYCQQWQKENIITFALGAIN